MGIKCPHCGGKAVFDIAAQALYCPYCESVSNVSEYDQTNAAQYNSDTYSMNLFTCRSCGAELVAPEEQTVGYCSYCGGEAVLTQKDTEFTRPKRIVPFMKTKQNAKSAYEAALRKKLYVPSEFRQALFIEGFRGIYLPYWDFDVEVPDKNIRLFGTKDYTSGKYDYHEEYVVETTIGGRLQSLCYDASEAFDDTIASEIAPFHKTGERPFSEAYLAGFYSDRVTTDPEIYADEAVTFAVDSVYNDVQKATGIELEPPEKDEGKRAQIGVTEIKSSVTLMPLWFLTWRKGDRVAYSVMNGQTGKLSADVPVDKKKFFLATAAGAAVLFLVLSMLSGFILPKASAVISAVFLLASTITLSKEIKRIYLKENHVYDLGNKKEGRVAKMSRRSAASDDMKKEKTAGKATGIVSKIVFSGGAGIALVLGVISVVGDLFDERDGIGLGGLGKIVFLIALILQILFALGMLKKSANMERKSVRLPAVLAPIVTTAGLLIFLLSPAADYWYYGAAILCLMSMLVNGLSSVNYFNSLTTRPVPNFYGREGADNAAD